MALSPDQLLKWGTPWALTIDLSTAAYATANGITVVTPAVANSHPPTIGGQRFLTAFGLVVTGIHMYSLANASPATVDVLEWDGSAKYPIFRTGDQVTYTTNVSYDIWHPLKPATISGATVTQGNVLRISTSAALGASARLRLEGIHTADPSLWNAYVSARALAANSGHITF